MYGSIYWFEPDYLAQKSVEPQKILLLRAAGRIRLSSALDPLTAVNPTSRPPHSAAATAAIVPVAPSPAPPTLPALPSGITPFQPSDMRYILLEARPQHTWNRNGGVIAELTVQKSVPRDGDDDVVGVSRRTPEVLFVGEIRGALAFEDVDVELKMFRMLVGNQSIVGFKVWVGHELKWLYIKCRRDKKTRGFYNQLDNLMAQVADWYEATNPVAMDHDW